MSANKRKSKTSHDDILSKLSNVEKVLMVLKSIKLEEPESFKEVQLMSSVVATYIINKFDSRTANLSVNISAGFKPSSIINIEFEYMLNLAFSESIEKDYFEENIESIISMLGADITLLVGLISEKMLSNILILPPMIQVKK